MEYKRLYKSSTDKAIFGVCGGIAEYFGIDSLIVRLVLVLCTRAFGAGLLFYIIAALIMPKRPEDGGPQVYQQPEQAGSYNAGGTTYVNRASSPDDDYQPYRHPVYETAAEPMPQEVTRSAAPQEQPAERPVPTEEPSDPVAKAWAKERETQEARGAAAGAPKEEPKQAAPKPEEPKQESPKQAPEQPQAKRSYQAYEAYQQPRQSAQQHSGHPSGNGNHSRIVLGIILMLIGAAVLVKIFLPRFDMRILFAVCMLAAGGLLIAKKD